MPTCTQSGQIFVYIIYCVNIGVFAKLKSVPEFW